MVVLAECHVFRAPRLAGRYQETNLRELPSRGSGEELVRLHQIRVLVRVETVGERRAAAPHIAQVARSGRVDAPGDPGLIQFVQDRRDVLRLRRLERATMGQAQIEVWDARRHLDLPAAGQNEAGDLVAVTAVAAVRTDSGSRQGNISGETVHGPGELV